MRVVFLKKKLYDFYVNDPESDMENVYHRMEILFEGKEEWALVGKDMEDLEEQYFQRIWSPYPRYDNLVRRLVNDALAYLEHE